MVDFKFRGDLTGLSERQLEFVSSVLQGRGFKNGNVTVSAVGKAGDGYVANVKRFTIEQNQETFKMVAKVATSNEKLRAQMHTDIAFRTETIMYTEVLPKFTELEKAADIPVKDRLRYAICYGSLNDEPNEIILLEDLNASNFVMMDRMVSLRDDNIRLVLNSFAKLHSLSYALKNQEPRTYDMFKTKLVNIWEIMKDVEQMTFFLEQMEKNVMDILDSDKHKQIVNGTLTSLLNRLVKSIDIDKKSKYSVIQQGDSWTNNIMFRFEGEKVVDCCMIDYQISKEITPVADIHYMIFNCTDYETRAKHYYEWIDYYHSELDKCLANHGLKASYIYPRDKLDADLKRFGKISFGFSLMLVGALMSESHETAKMKEAMESEDSFRKVAEISNYASMDNSTSSRIKARVEGLIASFTELGYL